MSKFRSIDPSWLILLLGLLVRVVALIQLDPRNGYDAAAHLRYTEILGEGRIPRVGVDKDTWAAQYPPFYYALAWMLSNLGLGDRGGQLVSLASGAVRLVLVDRFFARESMPRHGRAFANLLHAFLPFAVRIDVFYSNESLATTLAIASVMIASAERSTWRPTIIAIWTGLALGAALLTKSSAVAAIPAVCFALMSGCTTGVRAMKIASLRLAIAAALSAMLLLPWALPNLLVHKTPYPSAYATDTSDAWTRPLFARHDRVFYLPRFEVEDLRWPYHQHARRVSMPNTFLFEGWGDYYNFLSRGISEARPPESANGRVLTSGMRFTHVLLILLGVVFVAVFLAGAALASWRLWKGRMSCEETALSILGAGYVVLAVIFAISVVHEADGAVKATYALGAAPIFSLWTGAIFQSVSRRGVVAFGVAVLLAGAPAMVAVIQRFVF